MTDKYDLHTIDYSVEGWDTILATDMGILDEVIPSRELITLGETVATYDTMCFDVSTSTWLKALADGSLQPAHGLALASGATGDQIRIQRMGTIVNSAWSWATLGLPIYLHSVTAGGLTLVEPADNVQIMGYALASDTMLVEIVYGGATESTAIPFDIASPGPIGETLADTIRGKNKEIFVTLSASLSTQDCCGTIISNYGMGATDCLIEIAAAQSGLAFIAVLPTVQAKYVRFQTKQSESNKIYLSGVAGADDGFVGVASGYLTGAAASFFTFKASDGGYDWYCQPIFGTWVTA